VAYADPTATDRVEGLNKRQAAPLAGRRLHFKKDNIDVSTFTIPAAAGQAEETEKASTPWKDDDREWFAARPFRSHRLRALFSGEPMKSRDQDPPDAHHEIQVLVRQLAPGQRLRLGFWRNTECPIPDLEPVLHALFDIVSSADGKIYDPISVERVAERARFYSYGGQQQ
jgi:hypothetical protein